MVRYSLQCPSSGAYATSPTALLFRPMMNGGRISLTYRRSTLSRFRSRQHRIVSTQCVGCGGHSLKVTNRSFRSAPMESHRYKRRLRRQQARGQWTERECGKQNDRLSASAAPRGHRTLLVCPISRSPFGETSPDCSSAARMSARILEGPVVGSGRWLAAARASDAQADPPRALVSGGVRAQRAAPTRTPGVDQVVRHLTRIRGKRIGQSVGLSARRKTLGRREIRGDRGSKARVVTEQP